jgi:hypothetical protein
MHVRHEAGGGNVSDETKVLAAANELGRLEHCNASRMPAALGSVGANVIGTCHHVGETFAYERRSSSGNYGAARARRPKSSLMNSRSHRIGSFILTDLLGDGLAFPVSHYEQMTIFFSPTDESFAPNEQFTSNIASL